MRCDEIEQFTRSGSYRVDFSMRGLIENIDNYERKMGLLLCPDFQRGHVWTKEQQSAFVEYFLRGGRSGTTIYLNHPFWNSMGHGKGSYREFTLVDGYQRISAVRSFLGGEVPVFGGKYISDFEDDWLFDDHTLHAFTVCINDLKSRAKVLQWYIDMNRGGTPHSREEIARVEKLLSEEKQAGRCLRRGDACPENPEAGEELEER